LTYELTFPRALFTMVWLLAGADVFSAMTIFSTIVLYLSGW